MKYPSIYDLADNLSVRQQKKYFRIILFMCFFQILSAIYSQYLSDGFLSKYEFIVVNIAAVVFLLLYAFGNNYPLWRSSRAIAESIKSISWKFVTRVEPFNVSDIDAEKKLKEKIDEIVKKNVIFTKNMHALNFDDCFISDDMKSYRAMCAIDLFPKYNAERVFDQRIWFKNKSDYYKKCQVIARIVLAILFVITGLCLLFQEANLPFSATIAFIFDVILWMQVCRYEELKTTYAYQTCVLAKHYKDQLQNQQKGLAETELISYVKCIEQELTKENNQWLKQS